VRLVDFVNRRAMQVKKIEPVSAQPPAAFVDIGADSSFGEILDEAPTLRRRVPVLVLTNTRSAGFVERFAEAAFRIEIKRPGIEMRDAAGKRLPDQRAGLTLGKPELAQGSGNAETDAR